MRFWNKEEDWKRAVKRHLAEYELLEASIQTIEWEIANLPYLPEPSYGDEPRVFSSTPSRRTENLAIMMSEKHEEQRRAELIINAIHTGIDRAANECVQIERIQRIRTDLFNHMVKKQSLAHCRTSKDTISKYKKKAIYYIAKELKYI